MKISKIMVLLLGFAGFVLAAKGQSVPYSAAYTNEGALIGRFQLQFNYVGDEATWDAWDGGRVNPGQTVELNGTLNPSDFGSFNATGSFRWVLIEGHYDVEDVEETGEFFIDSTTVLVEPFLYSNTAALNSLAYVPPFGWDSDLFTDGFAVVATICVLVTGFFVGRRWLSRA